jgi:polygalacturonase
MREYNIKEFGAIADGKTNNAAAIQAAVDACACNGGGRVLVCGGTYLTGTVVLRSNVELHLAADGVLLASASREDFPEFPKLHVDVTKLSRFSGAAMIFAEECENISITGKGKIDANGYAYVEECEPYHSGWKYKRISTDTLPRVVFFTGCKNVFIEDVTAVNSPAGWTYLIHDCDYVHFDKIKILCSLEFPNNDGIHINSSRDVTVANSFIQSGDDAIIIRAANRALKEPKVCERIMINNCTLMSHTNAVRIGWIGDGVIRNCTLSNLCIDETRTGITITLPGFGIAFSDNVPETTSDNSKKKNDIKDFGVEKTCIENISFNNIVMRNIYLRPVQIEICEEDTTPCEKIGDIYFNSIKSESLGMPVIVGRENCHVKNIRFNGCDFRQVPLSKMDYYFEPTLSQITPLILKYADNVSFADTTFSSEE